MSIETLTGSLLSLPAFHARFKAVTIHSVTSQFPALARRPDLLEVSHDWSYLLQCASVLAQARNEICEDTSLRIAQHCLTHGPRDDAYRDAACVILDMLTNKPSIQLAEHRHLVTPNVESRLPLPIRAAWLRREIDHTVIENNGDELSVNRFQKEVWHAKAMTQILSVTAPTSTGKSFLFRHWLADYIFENPDAFVVYLVPTRALIQQVEGDLRQQFTHARLTNTNVSSLPIASALKDSSANVMVLTPERLHILLIGLPPGRLPQLMIVDEAHKLGDGARGVLLHNVIDSVLKQAPSVKLLFASPMVSNPEILLRGRDSGRSRAISSFHVTVNQNLLWVSQVARHPKKWTVELCFRDSIEELGRIELPFRPDPSSKRLTFVAHVLGDKQGGNLVYADGAADAEKTAIQLWDLTAEPSERDTDLQGLVDLVKKTIHPEYRLVQTLERGIAFHYGNMPLLIRTEIERLFKEGKVHFLVCTSTLIEGVNLPCKSIFVRGPHKGRGKPMSETDFWNLAGRAGRLGKEFQGNIICIDPRRVDVWGTTPPTKRGTYPIKPAADKVFDDFDGFVSYLDAEAPTDAALAHPEYDQLLTYLLAQYSEADGLAKSSACSGLSSENRIRLEQTVQRVLGSLTIPFAIVNRNPGISPFAMQKLLRYFEGYEKPLEELLPVLPESEDAVDVYVHILGRVNAHLAPVFSPPGRTFALALLIVDWMRGHSLARLISSRLSYLRKKGREYDLQKEIRSAMEDVEQVARFTAPKFLSCYIDVLRHRLVQADKQDMADGLPDVSLWLEFGATQVTQLSMMGIGLSRTSAIALSEYIVDDSLSQEAVLQKLRDLKIESLSLPKAILREVKRVLGSE